MDPTVKAGAACIVIGVILFVFEGVANRKGFGQLVAVMRTTVLLIGVVLIVVGLVR